MALFIKQEEVERLKNAAPDSFQKKLYNALVERTYRNTQVPGFLQPGDTQEWWHLCWERASDAAFTWYMERDEKLGEWIRNCAFTIADQDEDTWIGPWYRFRGKPEQKARVKTEDVIYPWYDMNGEEKRGALETAHMALALCEFISVSGELFNEEETKHIKEVLHEVAMPLCIAFCNNQSWINNWYSVLLTGFGVSAVVTEDKEAIDLTVRMLRDVANLFNDDSYGESVQYSNYCALCFSHLQETLLRYDESLLPMMCFDTLAKLMPWYASSMLYMKPLHDGEKDYPRCFNFGDCAAIFRPTGNVLAQVAVRMKNRMPREAKLATWLLNTTYKDPEFGPDELATFGFVNQFAYYTVLMQPDMIEARSPYQLGLPLVSRFNVGHVIMRDDWEEPKMQIAMQAGFDSLNVTSHRHEDQLSVQVAVNNERMLIDAGHCCYRTKAWKFSTSSSQHNLFDFVKEDGTILGQIVPRGNYLHRAEPTNKDLIRARLGSCEVVVSDATDSYGPEVTKAVRAMIAVLPGAMFIVDHAETAVPLVMRDHFAANNRDGKLRVHEKTKHRIVFRRPGAAMKLFECTSWVDGVETESNLRYDFGYCHDHYHPLSNQDGQSKEGAGLIYSWDDKKPATSHTRVFAIATNDEETIKSWHIRWENGTYGIYDEKDALVLQIHVAPNGKELYLVKEDGTIGDRLF